MAKKKKERQVSGKVPFYKKKGFWIALGVFAVLSMIFGEDDKEAEEPSKDTTAEVVSSIDTTDSIEDASSTEEEEITEIDRDGVIGKSDGNIDDVDKLKPRDMRNDVTGNWRLVTTSKNMDMRKYGKSYADKYMEDGQVHVIVSFATNTTTTINKGNGMLSVHIYEYVKKEEHDAKKVGNGMLLGSYNIYLDNGDIQKITNE